MGTSLDRGGAGAGAPVSPSVTTPQSTPTIDPKSPAMPAWRSKRAWVLLALVTLFGVVSDLGSKHLAFAHLADRPVRVEREQVLATRDLGTLIPGNPRVTIVPRVLDLTLVLNPGAVFGMGAGKRLFFVGFTIFAAGFAVWMFATWTSRRDWASHAAIGLILAGGIGNLYDRLVYACVRDFLHPLPGMMLPFGWSWPWGGREVWPYVSNIADLWLLVGIGVLLVKMLREPAPSTSRSRGAAARAE